MRNWRLAEAYKWVKDKRPSINISQSAHGGENPRIPGRMHAGMHRMLPLARMLQVPAYGPPACTLLSAC